MIERKPLLSSNISFPINWLLSKIIFFEYLDIGTDKIKIKINSKMLHTYKRMNLFILNFIKKINYFPSISAINGAAIFFDLPRNFTFFIESRLDKSLSTTTKPIMPIVLWGVHQYA